MRGETMILEFVIPANLVLNANHRLHYQATAKKVKALRVLGKRAAEGLVFPDPCLLVAYLGFPDKRRRDLHNLYPTLKALIDGIVDAGALLDDSHQHLAGPDLRVASEKSDKGFIRVRMEVVSVSAADTEGNLVCHSTQVPSETYLYHLDTCRQAG